MSKLTRISPKSKNFCYHVVLVHGLGGDGARTWNTGASGSLPKNLNQDLTDACIWTITYDAGPVWRNMSIQDRSDNLALLLDGQITDSLPLFFVTHSLGGLVMKHVLVAGHDQATPHQRRVFDRTKALFFLATPHRGSRVADYFRLRGLGNVLISQLRYENDFLLDLLGRYETVAHQRICTAALGESRAIKIPIPWLDKLPIRTIMVVERPSADVWANNRATLVDRDHQEITVTKSRTDEVHTALVKLIRDCVARRSFDRVPPEQPRLTMRQEADRIFEAISPADQDWVPMPILSFGFTRLESGFQVHLMGLLALAVSTVFGDRPVSLTVLRTVGIEQVEGAPDVLFWHFYVPHPLLAARLRAEYTALLKRSIEIARRRGEADKLSEELQAEYQARIRDEISDLNILGPELETLPGMETLRLEYRMEPRTILLQPFDATTNTDELPGHGQTSSEALEITSGLAKLSGGLVDVGFLSGPAFELLGLYAELGSLVPWAIEINVSNPAHYRLPTEEVRAQLQQFAAAERGELEQLTDYGEGEVDSNQYEPS